jgi:diguanylate cyclase (GGDEF)-like protein
MRARGGDLAERMRTDEAAVQRHVRGRHALFEMSRAVNSTIDPARIADLLLDQATSWVPAAVWAVVAIDPSAATTLLASRGTESEWDATMRSVAEWVIQRGEVFSTADLAGDDRVANLPTAAVVALPLVSRGRRVGALIALDPKPAARAPKVGAGWLRAVETVLEPAASALESAIRFKRVEALSVTDDLTQLYNSRYLNQVLRRETKRASRSGRPLSLLFVDLDGFKTVNDSYGHLFGSRALVEAAAVIRGSARETDVVARFGGDEFALVLPDTGGDGAMAVGERIRERVAAFRFLTRDRLNVRLTASVGVATLPDAAASAEELVQEADKAMYQVKQSGKNGIQAATSYADK